MKKIPTIFVRNPGNMREILNIHHPDCYWVFRGEGEATRKFDGTCCRIKDGELWKRREVKKGKQSPEGFEEVQCDSNTGKRVGWVRVDPQDPQDKYHREAFSPDLCDGTYELCGPKVQGNPEGFSKHILIPHGSVKYGYCPRSYFTLKFWLMGLDIEGVVFHHQDGRMAKIKLRDFGLRRVKS